MNADKNTLPLCYYPNPILREECESIKKVDDSIRALAKQMRLTMLAAKGIGLAAPQIGQPIRLFVADISKNQNEPLALINPVITHKEGNIVYAEGCLSIPDASAEVKRARLITVTGLSLNEEEITLEAEDLLAVCIQHEIDHLNGVLFFDHISLLKRARLLQKYKKAQLPTL